MPCRGWAEHGSLDQRRVERYDSAIGFDPFSQGAPLSPGKLEVRGFLIFSREKNY